jgi:hypothetical protein
MVVQGEENGRVDAIEFYGMGLDNPYSDTRTYWLVAGNALGMRMDSVKTWKTRPVADSGFPFTMQWKPRTLYFAALLNGDADNFFGPTVGPDPVSQNLNISHLSSAGPGASQLQVTLQGVTAGGHNVAIQLNGSQVGTVTFSDQNEGTATFAILNAQLHEGGNALTLTAQGGASDVTAVDTVLLTYPHSYTADNDSLEFTLPTEGSATIGGFSNAQIQVVDITDPDCVLLVPATVEQTGASYRVLVTLQAGALRLPGLPRAPHPMGSPDAPTTSRTLLAVASSQFASPASIAWNQGSSWHSAQTGADMVILSHASLLAAVAPLVSLRQSQGHTVQVIDVEDLYNEFNFGMESPYAIQSFLSAAQANWTTKPAYVLLMGNGTFDPRNYLGTTVPDLVPVKLVDTSLLETASDDWFADFNNDGISEMAIGRIPAETVSDATNAVTRLIAYDQSGGGSSKNRVLLVAGANQNLTDDFEGYTALVKALLPDSVTATQILVGSDPQARSDLMAGLNAGASLVNYVGHGSTEVWADGLLSSTDAAGLTNGGMTPVVLSMTCLNGYFQDVYTNALGKALLNASSGGAVAVWASSGLTNASPQSGLNQAMVSALYGVAGTTIGQAAMAAKSATTNIDVRRTWILFGDPTMIIR